MKTNIVKIKLISFVSELTLYTPIIALYFLGIGLTLGEVVFAQVFYSLGMMLGEIPTGIFSDKYGRKVSVLVGHALDVIGLLTLLILPEASVLYGINLLRGLGGAFLSGSYEALLYESVLEQKDLQTSYAKTYSAVLSLSSLGFITATALSALVTGMLGVNSYYWLILGTATAQIISFIVALTLFEQRNNKDSPVVVEEKPLALLKEGLRVVYGNHVVFYLALAAVLTINGEYFLRSMYQPLLRWASMPLEYLGFILSAGATINFIVMRRFHSLERFFTLPQLLLMIYISTALGYFVLSVSQNLLVLSGATILLFGIFNVDRPLVSEYINEHLTNSVRNTALSTVSFAGSIGTITQRIFLSYILSDSGLIAGLQAQSTLLIFGTFISFWAMTRCGCVRRRSPAMST